ncbi:hypothetical protein ABTY20_31535 [Streptomyces sp. NPDC126497]|uniref:hypothetical protein n=1 Tax=Streptomyces sp. NPDC126497 TaxID=3155313 RepID=UPI0033169838
MALVAHRDVTDGMVRHVMTLLAGGLGLLLLSGCSSSSDGEPEPRPSASASTPSASAASRSPELEEQALEAVSNDTVDDADFVEAGSENLADGIHARSSLDKGKSYQLAVVCMGRGEAQMVVTYAKVEKRETLICDGTVSYLRISDAPDQLKLDVDAAVNGAGAAAWRISRVRL